MARSTTPPGRPIDLVRIAGIAGTSCGPQAVTWLLRHAFREPVGCFRSTVGTGYTCR